MTYEIRALGCTAFALVEGFQAAKIALIEAHQLGLNARLFIVDHDGARILACEECGGASANCAGPHGCTY